LLQTGNDSWDRILEGNTQFGYLVEIGNACPLIHEEFLDLYGQNAAPPWISIMDMLGQESAPEIAVLANIQPPFRKVGL
jgi:hypothetical protein